MKGDKNSVAVNFFIVLLLVFFGLTCVIVTSDYKELEIEEMRKKAVEMGVAKYILNEQTGNVDFIWEKNHGRKGY